MTESNNFLKITVITITYNAEKYLEQTIKSVIEQDYKNIEYIIIDGGSTDSTVDIIKKYEQYINYWISEPDNGIYHAMNNGTAVATGKWINFLNAGDTFCSTSTISDISKCFEKDLSMVYGGANTIDEYSLVSVYQPPSDLSVFAKKMPCCHQAVFFNRSVFYKYQFNTLYKINADLDLILQLYTQGHKYKYINMPIVNFLKDGYHAKDKPRGYLDELYVTSKYLQRCSDIYNHQAYQFLKNCEEEAGDDKIVFSQKIGLLLEQVKTFSKKYTRIVLYGNGSFSILLQSFLAEQVVNVLDMGSENENGFLVNPCTVNKLEYDVILVTLLGREAEVKKLLMSHGVLEHKIMILSW